MAGYFLMGTSSISVLRRRGPKQGLIQDFTSGILLEKYNYLEKYNS